MQSYQLGQRFTTAGLPLNGGKAYFYLTETLTLEDVFEDAALATPLANPVVADSAGLFPELVYLDPTKTYRLIVKTSADVTIFDADPINTAQGGTGIDTADIEDGAITSDKLADGAIEAKLGFTPADDAELTTLDTAFDTLAGAMTGLVLPFLRSAAPDGWVKCAGGTIGDATSGGTARANADTADLFALLWALDATNFPITDSGGGASTRGASAAADFAAHKRLPLPDMRAEFVRGLDDSRGVDSARALGSAQAGQMSSHTHTVAGGNDSGTFAYLTMQSNTASPGISTAAAGGTENSSENRPRNIALLYCAKL